MRATLTTALAALALTAGTLPAQAVVHDTEGWEGDVLTVVDQGTKSYDLPGAIARWNAAQPPITLQEAPRKASSCADVDGPCVTVTTGRLEDKVGGRAQGDYDGGEHITRCHVTLTDKPPKGHGTDMYRTNILMHELGHCVGLDHAPTGLSGVNSLMLPHVTGVNTLTAYDLADLHSIYTSAD